MSQEKNSRLIHLVQDLKSYFDSQLQDTARKQGVDMSHHTRQYLSQVLERFVNTSHLLVKNVPENPEAKSTQSFPTLAWLWLEGMSAADTYTQFIQMQHLGDVALFTSGFFGQRLKNAVDMDYFVAMGGRAYERAGQLRETLTAERMLNVYFELARGFEEFKEIFAELSEQSQLNSDQELLKLYERWLENRSDRLHRMLVEKGIIPKLQGPSGSEN